MYSIMMPEDRKVQWPARSRVPEPGGFVAAPRRDFLIIRAEGDRAYRAVMPDIFHERCPGGDIPETRFPIVTSGQDSPAVVTEGHSKDGRRDGGTPPDVLLWRHARVVPYHRCSRSGRFCHPR